MGFKEVASQVVEAVFPRYCLNCNCYGSWFCHSCLSKISPYNNSSCWQCRQGFVGGQTCLECNKLTSVKKFVSAVSYETREATSLVHNLKYGGVMELAQPCGLACWEAWQDSGCLLRSWLVVPIPLHKVKEVSRGFNQSELIAKEIVRHSCYEIDADLLVRAKATQTQAKLSKDERQLNVIGVFKLVKPDRVLGRSILLIDDVATTGETLSEAAKVLMAGGAAYVSALVYARGDFV